MENPRGRRSVIPLVLVSAFLLPALCSSAFALNPALDVSQYAHTSWKIRDGFPKGEISSIAQTPDGYLWLGTEFGLFRFDGLRPVQWRPPGNQELPSNWIFSLLVSRDGTLWIGTAQGLVSWKDGKLTQYAELAGRYIFAIVEDREGSIWASGGAIPAGRLCAIRNGSVQCYGDDGSFGRAVFNLYEDSKGNLWAGVLNGLWRWKPGPPQFYSLPGEPDGIQCLGEDTDGTLLFGWNGGLHRFVNGKPEPSGKLRGEEQIRGRRMLRDRDGSLWIGAFNQGIVHVREGRSDVFGHANGLSGETGIVFFEDREGSIWVATESGLDRFRAFAIATFSVNQGFSSSKIQSVLADRDKNVGIWLATRNDVNRWHNGQVTALNISPDKQDGKLNRFAPNSLFQDDTGRIWVSTPFEFGYLAGNRFVSVSTTPGPISGIAQDTAKVLWFANEHRGLVQVVGNKEVQQIPWSKLGHTDHASTIIADPKGGLWLGFFHGGLAYYNDGQIRQSYSTGEGLAPGRVSDLQFEQDGALWIATEGGLSRLKNGRVATLTSENGLPCNAVHWLKEDDNRFLWLYTSCGLLRVARAELDSAAAALDQDKNAKATIRVTLFDSSDGVRIFGTGNHFSPQVAKSADGQLWFSAGDGLSLIDPNRLPFNSVAPPVQIEQFVADRKTYDASNTGSASVRLPPLIRDLQIDYTALSLGAPEKIQFRYKLEGRDNDWQEAGNRRQAFYNDLSPGNYRFRVIACNNSGVWNETGAYVDFTIAPAYYQTAWFRIAVLICLCLRWVVFISCGCDKWRGWCARGWKNVSRKGNALPETCTILFCKACRD